MVVDIEFMFYWSIYLTPSIWVCLESVEVSIEYRGLLYASQVTIGPVVAESVDLTSIIGLNY